MRSITDWPRRQQPLTLNGVTEQILSNPQRRRIAHLDMDAFYASVELLRYPQLRGEPVVIGGGRRRSGQADTGAGEFARLRDYAGRGVITTATYAARAFGVQSGMGLMKAAQLCPQAVMLPVDFDEYRRFSRLFKQVVTDFAPPWKTVASTRCTSISTRTCPAWTQDNGRALAGASRRQSSSAPG